MTLDEKLFEAMKINNIELIQLYLDMERDNTGSIDTLFIDIDREENSNGIDVSTYRAEEYIKQSIFAETIQYVRNNRKVG